MLFRIGVVAANRGLEERRIKLGCVMPGESVAIFGDALRRLSGAATYLYYDAARYWYSTQPTVTKIAEDRAEQLKADPDSVVQELERRIRMDVRERGDFNAVHPLPQSGQDIPDDLDARLVVLRIEYPHTKDAGSPARAAAAAFLETRGASPRLYRNTLVFLAVDRTRLQDLDEAVRRYLAWVSILDESDLLDLSQHQIKQAEQQKENAAALVRSRIPEAYHWLLVPVQPLPQQAMSWQALRLTGDEALAARVSKRLRKDEMLITNYAGTSLRTELDRIPLWRGDHVSIRQLTEDFARYVYLPRLARPQVLLNAIIAGLELITWERESVAFADSYDETTGRYRGLRYGHGVMLTDASTGLLVKSEAARRQIDADAAAAPVAGPISGQPGFGNGGTIPNAVATPSLPTATPPKRFHGTVSLDPTRVGRDAGRIADEVISHLSGLIGAKVVVTLEIDAQIPGGAPDNVVRTVTENGRTLRFSSQGFEKE